MRPLPYLVGSTASASRCRMTRGPAGRWSAAHDHVHRGASVRPYSYRAAETLMDDFWREVEAILKKEGVE